MSDKVVSNKVMSDKVMSNSVIRILVAEDHLVARVGVTTIVNMQPDMTDRSHLLRQHWVCLHCLQVSRYW